jgi:hypothetical protein
MELKEFVRETLLQLTEGVREAQEECRKHGGMVNPMLEAPRVHGSKAKIGDKYYPVTDVGFKVGLTENNGVKDKTGIGVFFSSIAIGVEQKKDTGHQAVTCIDFSIPVLLPYIGRDGELVDLSIYFH